MPIESQKFDVLLFITLEASILAIAGVWLTESIRKREYAGGFAAVVVFVFRTGWNYWRARGRKSIAN